jgi:hypothetical protein
VNRKQPIHDRKAFLLDSPLREADMTVREIIHTCSNAHVARAALISIGGEFAAKVSEKARETDLTAGAYVAFLVKDFSRQASDDDWDDVDEAARGADQPILFGLRHIVGKAIGVRAGPSIAIEGLCSSKRIRGAFTQGASAF